MDNIVLAQIIKDRFETARTQIAKSFTEASAALIAAEDHAVELHKIAQANPQNEIARREYGVAAREFRTLEAIVADADRLTLSLSVAVSEIATNIHRCGRLADRLIDAINAKEAPSTDGAPDVFGEYTHLSKGIAPISTPAV